MSLAERDRAVLWHPYTQMKTADPPLEVARAEGVWLELTDGRRVLDAISSWWVNVHGHSHPRLNAALARQAATLEHVIFAGFTHEPAVRLAEELIEILPAGLSRIFYSDNGSTAVEVALKMTLQFWRNRGENRRRRFIALHGAYHGDTVGAMSASESGPFTAPFAPFLFDVVRVDAPYAYRCERCTGSCTTACLDSLRSTLQQHGEEIAGVIVEPMLQGAGGMIIAPAEFLAGVRRLCDEFGVKLIADEVLTGFGRTGKMFACEHAGITPDLLCMSKGLTAGYLPMGATAATEEIYDAFLSEDRLKTFFHGHSYTANPLACGVGLESLAIFREENVLQRIVRLEVTMRERLERYREHPHVGDLRSIGGVAAIELVSDRATREAGGYLDRVGPHLYREFISRGVLLRPLGNVLYVMPPYVITDDEVHFVFDQIDEVLQDWRWPS